MMFLLLACASPSEFEPVDDNAPDLVTAEFDGDLETWIVAEVTCVNNDGTFQRDYNDSPFGYKGAWFDENGVAIIVDESNDRVDLTDCPRKFFAVWDSYGPTTDPTIVFDGLTAVIDDETWVPLANSEWDELAGLEFEPA